MSGKSPGRFAFSRSRRILRRREYLELQGGRARDGAARGDSDGGDRVLRRRTGRFVVLLRPRSAGGPGRLGITAPRGVGPAVRRNRIRRLVREAYRTVPDLFPAGHDVVVLVISGEGAWRLSGVVEELARWKQPRSRTGEPPTAAGSPPARSSGSRSS